MSYYTPDDIKRAGRRAVDIREKAQNHDASCFYDGRRYAIEVLAPASESLAHEFLDYIYDCESAYSPNFGKFIDGLEHYAGAGFKIMIESFQSRNK